MLNMRWPIVTILLGIAATSMGETLLYRNTFNNSSALHGWVAEGPVNATVSNDTLTLAGGGGPDDYFVYWLPEVFPDRIRITWEFQPIQEPGLAMFFFGATSVSGGSIFDPSLKPRNGSYHSTTPATSVSFTLLTSAGGGLRSAISMSRI
jgi:hypothetical protein